MIPGSALVEPPAVRDRAVGLDQDDASLAVRKAEDQDLAHELSDLPGREVDDGCDLAAGELLLGVKGGELRRGALHADLGSEIDAQAIGGTARLREILDRNDRADADIDFENRRN
jgi:hypothetical protein